MNTYTTKAIIAVAGFGTRWLPLTKAIEKCMLPVGSRPVVDYLVEDCVSAGIKDIYFVVGEQSDQLRRYYGENEALQQHLRHKGKLKELEQLERIKAQANFYFVVQSSSSPYGTAVPVMLCEQFIQPGEQVVVLMGDQFVHNKDGASEVGRLLREVEACGVGAGMGVVNVPREEVYKYGIVEVETRSDKQFFKQIVEKPKVEDAPSTLNNLSMYVFDSEMFGCLQRIQPTNGEYYLTDALNLYVGQLHRQLAVVSARGEYLDCGNVEGWLHANEYILEEKK